MDYNLRVKKYDGSIEPFSEEKYRAALVRSGLTPHEIDTVVAKIIPTLKSPISTKQLYAHTFGLLQKMRSPLAAYYSLKKAILALGPSGYPFELFIGRLFTAMGYDTQVGVRLEGRCVSHEVDVVARNDQEQVLIECKFHTKQEYRSRIKDPLYVKARFDDLIDGFTDRSNDSLISVRSLLVTNTKFSSDVYMYGPCANIGLLSWNYPGGRSLAWLIDHYKLYPITCLNFLSNTEIRAFIKQGIILCRQIQANPDLVPKVVHNISKQEQLLGECGQICGKHQRD